MYISPRARALLLAALSLMSALTAQAAPLNSTPISALPFNITVPGNYTLTGNLTLPYFGEDITINLQSPGKVVLDLGGFTLSGGYFGVYIYNPAGNSITVQNGTIQGSYYGVLVYGDNADIEHITFNQTYYDGVLLENSNSSMVDNCTFNGNSYQGAIYDSGTRTGNSYSNDTFDGQQYSGTLRVVYAGSGSPIVLKNCDFSPPKPAKP